MEQINRQSSLNMGAIFKIWFSLLLVFMCVMFPQSNVQAAAGTYYVSTTGSDSNPGSIDKPWRTIQYAVNRANAGDTIYIRGGYYGESVYIQRSGANGSPITVSAYNGESVEINGGSNIAIYTWSGQSYWTFENLTIKSNGRFAVRMGWWGETSPTNYWTLSHNSIVGAILVRGHDNKIEYNDISGVGYSQDGAGIQDIEEVSYNNIYRNNSIHDFTAWNGRGIWLETRTHDSLVEGNQIWNITGSNGQCIDLDGYNSLEWRHIIRKNTVRNCTAIGIQLENTFATVVENNIVINGGTGGIVVTNYGDGMCQAGGESNQFGDTNRDGSCLGDMTENIIQQNLVIDSKGMGGIVSYNASGVRVLNNTIARSSSYGIWLGPTATSHHWEVRNNIIAFTDAPCISTYSFSQLSVDDNNGLIRNNWVQVYEQTMDDSGLTLAQYQSKTGKGMHSYQTNPMFVDMANGDFHTMKSSPMVDRGADTGLKLDLDGQKRPQGAGYDIGAYEINVVTVIYENNFFLPAIMRSTQ